MRSALQASPLPQQHASRRSRLLLRGCVALAIVVGLLLVAALVLARHVLPMVRSRLLQTFQDSFRSPVSIQDLQVRYDGGFQVDGKDLVVQSVLNGIPGDPSQPMLRVHEFHFHVSLLAALSSAPRIHHVRIRGVQLDLPAESATQRRGPKRGPGVDLEYAEVDDVHIRYAAAAADRAPFVFDLPHLVFRGVSRSRPIRFHAVIDNGPPLGITESDGTIGPWNFDDPRQTPIQGRFHLQDKEMSSIRGLRGRLTLDGSYSGTVGQLHAVGTSADPAFALDVSSHPVDLRTRFSVTLQPAQNTVAIDKLEGSFGKSAFVCTGVAVKDRATGQFRWDVQLDAPAARVEDALMLGTPTAPPVLRGALAVHGRLQMSAGPASVSRKLSLHKAEFALGKATFSNPAMQQAFDELSERAQGHPKDANAADAAMVTAEVHGTVALQSAVLRFDTMRVVAPGSTADLHGSYSLDGTQFDLDGVIHTEARLSHMTKGVKRILLSPFDHLLGHSTSKAGASLPIHIHGAHDAAHVEARVAGLWVKAPGTQ